LTDFQNSFTDTHSRHFAIQLVVGLRRVVQQFMEQIEVLVSKNCVKVAVFERFLCGKTSTICQQWSRLSSLSKQGSYSATVSTSWDKKLVLTTHYDTSITLRLANNI